MQGQYREPLIESITISDSNAATSPVVPSNTSPKTATCSAWWPPSRSLALRSRP